MASYGEVWRARIQMMRPGNGLMAALGALVGMAVVRTGPLPTPTWVAAPFAAFLVAGFGNVWNDVHDVEVDRRAHPERPLPSGRMKIRDAKAFAGLLLAFGLFEAFVAGGLVTLAFAVANALLLALYEARLKARGLSGNALVAFLVASTFAFGAAATQEPPRAWGVLWLLITMAFLANLARELLKDLEDAAADRGRRRTFPLQTGAGPTRILAFFLVNGAVGLSVRAFLHPPEGWWPWWLGVLAAADLLFVAASCLAWMRLSLAQRLLKAAMALALAAFFAGPVVP